ncbi:MAG: Txe/YoeB family addiction module toxin [Bacteroidota bacterium]
MEFFWQKPAWEDYLYWQRTDKLILQKINALIRECLRDPFHGTGKPEALKGSLSGCWSRRINAEHRLVYKVKEDRLHILQCRYHYG